MLAVGVGRHDQDWCVLRHSPPTAPDIPDDLEPLFFRHVEVDDHDVGLCHGDRFMGQGGIRTGENLRYAHCAQQPLDQRRGEFIVINEGYAHVAQVVGATDTYDGRAVAFADLGNHGALDVIVANQRGPLLIYRNAVASGRHWIQFELEATGKRSAIGSRVEMHWNGKVQAQEVAAASGFSAQSQRRIHYGLGTATAVDRVVIRWPSGAIQTIEHPAIDQLHKVKQSVPDGR